MSNLKVFLKVLYLDGKRSIWVFNLFTVDINGVCRLCGVCSVNEYFLRENIAF